MWSIIIIMRRIVSVRRWSSIAWSCIPIAIVGDTIFTWSTVATVRLSIAVVISSISVISIMFRPWFTWLMVLLSLYSMVVAPVIIGVALTMIVFKVDDASLSVCLLQVCLPSALLFKETILFLLSLSLGC